MRHILCGCGLLFFIPLVVQAQATKPRRVKPPSQPEAVAQTSAETTEPVEPASCVEFDEMAARVDAVITQEEITEDDFRNETGKDPSVVRNAHKEFEIGNVRYMPLTTGHFWKFTTHEDNKTEFLKWYNNGGGHWKLFTAGMKCISDYNAQVRASNNPAHQATLQMNTLKVYAETSQAASIEEEDYRHDFVEFFRAISQGQGEMIALKDRYNALVDDFNKYGDATHVYINSSMNYIQTLESKLRNRPAPLPVFSFPPPRPEITCRGSANTFGNIYDYGDLATLSTNTSLYLHCE